MLNLISYTVCKTSPWPAYNDFIIVGITIVSIFLCSWFVNFVAKRYIVKITQTILHKLNHSWAEVILKYKSLDRLSHIAPGIVVYGFAVIFKNHGEFIVQSIGNFLEIVSSVYIILAITFSLSSLLNATNAIYNLYPVSRKLPIKTYIQVMQLLLCIFTAVIVISLILGTSPLSFFTGLGAATAIIMLVFKDSILGFVSSVQLSMYDIIRIGDWITVPSLNVDGDVIEVSLSTVKIRNFDKTIITVPTYSLMSNGVQNWRGMSELGGRRIRRAINIDISTIKFCDDKDLHEYKKIKLVKHFVENKMSNLSYGHVLNSNPVSNIEVFRNYVQEYLKNNINIYKKSEFTFLIRELEPGQDGSLPVQIYVFTDTNWVNYESIQADIIDHLLCAVKSFNLRIFKK